MVLSMVIIGVGIVMTCSLSFAHEFHNTFGYYDAVDYLRRYGYLTSSLPWERGPSLTTAVTEFQRRAHLNVTGLLDDATLEMMTRKRCGVPDVFRVIVTSRRFKRYVLDDTRWSQTHITYCIKSYPSVTDASTQDVHDAFSRAFEVWASVSALTFSRLDRCDGDIVIEFERGFHGDGVPFDGRGSTLAHAYFPGDNGIGLHGDIHFDADESWTTQGSLPEREDLYCVAVHEIGHSLGLQHSDVEGAIMWPWVRDCTGSPLTDDDIRGIQALYGPPQETTPATERPSPSPIPQTTPAPIPEEDPDRCDGRIDSVTVGVDGRIYSFKGPWVYVLTLFGVALGYPRHLPSVFPGAPFTVDASVTVRRGRLGGGEQVTYLVKDGQRYAYGHNATTDRFYPLGVPESFSGAFQLPVSSIDSAFQLMDQDVFYVSQGPTYWEMDIDDAGLTTISEGRQLSSLRQTYGIPAFHTALRWNDDRVYLFYEDHYFRWENNGITWDIVGPRNTAVWWFGCPSVFK